MITRVTIQLCFCSLYLEWTCQESIRKEGQKDLSVIIINNITERGPDIVHMPYIAQKRTISEGLDIPMVVMLFIYPM